MLRAQGTPNKKRCPLLMIQPQMDLFSLFYSVLRYEPHRFHDGYLQITVKDRGLLGNGIFLGEAFLPLNELKLGDLDQRLSDLPQIQLPLTRPTGYGETFCYLLL